MARISAISSESSPSNIKDILRAGHILLQPPEPLPTTPAILHSRVDEADRFLSHRWDENLYINTGESVAVNALEDDISLDKDSAVSLIGPRCLDLLLELQRVLVKEFWPAEVRGEYEARDFILGTADLRLVRLMITHSLALLKLQSEAYLVSLGTGAIDPDPSLKPTLLAFFSLLAPTPQPPSPGPSVPRRLPPTTITQLLTTSHLPPIILTSILLGYTPSLPPPVHADSRRSLLSVLKEISPAQAISALSSVRPLLSAAPKSPDSIQSSPQYPEYIQHTVNRQLSAQLLRHNGPLGLLLNLFGERALSDAETIDDKKVDHAVIALCRLPAGVEGGKYVKHVVVECMGILGVPRKGQGKAPRAFRLVAAGVVGQMVGNYSEAKEAVEERLACIGTNEAEGQEGMKEKWEALELLDTLINHLDPSILPSFFAQIVRPLGSGLLRFVEEDPTAAESSSIKGDESDIDSTRSRIVQLAKDILHIWISLSPGTSTNDMGLSLASNDQDDIDGLSRTFASLHTSAVSSIHESKSSQSELDRLFKIFTSNKDPPAHVEIISQMISLLQNPSISPYLVQRAVQALVQGVEYEEAFVHLKAISALGIIAGIHGEVVYKAVEVAYLGRMDSLRQNQAVENGSEGKVLRLAEAIIGIVRSLGRAGISRGSDYTSVLRDQLEGFMQDQKVSETIRISVKAVVDLIDSLYPTDL